MAIPDGRLYHDGPLSAGTIATIEPSTVNTENAGAEIGFGTAVTIKDGKVVPATKAPIYGVAIKRTYIDSDHFYDAEIQKDKWKIGETLGVLRDGTIAVSVSSDVDYGDNATVDTTGKFKTASAGDDVVGVFKSSANNGSVANLQTRVQFGKQDASANPVNNDSGK